MEHKSFCGGYIRVSLNPNFRPRKRQKPKTPRSYSYTVWLARMKHVCKVSGSNSPKQRKLNEGIALRSLCFRTCTILTVGVHVIIIILLSIPRFFFSRENLHLYAVEYVTSAPSGKNNEKHFFPALNTPRCYCHF